MKVGKKGSLWRFLVLLALAAAAAGFFGLEVLFPRHLRAVTGRSDIGLMRCTYCHRKVLEPPRGGNHVGLDYMSPAGLAVSPDGKTLYVAAEGADRLLVVDLGEKRVRSSLPIQGRPHGVAVSSDGERLAVTGRDGDRVLLLDAATLETVETLPTGYEPLAAAFRPLMARNDSLGGAAEAAEKSTLQPGEGGGTGSRQENLYTVNGTSGDLSILTPGRPGQSLRLRAGTSPYGLAVAADGRLLAVANRMADPGPPRRVPASEVTLVDLTRNRVTDRRKLVSAHLSEGIALSSDGSFALVGAVRVRNLLPLTQVARGAVMNSVLVYLETKPDGRTVQFPLGDVNSYFADPSGVVLTPDDRIAFVAAGGANIVIAVDVEALQNLVQGSGKSEIASVGENLALSAGYILARIPTGENPRQMVLSPEGGLLYVAERLNDSIAVIDVKSLTLTGRIDLGGPKELTPERRGERVFSNASVTFQGQFSCRSCHPDGHHDGLVYDFDIDGIGRNLLETRSLRGIRDTAPFKWNGKNPDLATQCGPRFALVLTRSDPFPPEDLQDLVRYIESIPLPPVRLPKSLAKAREEGRKIFHRAETKKGAEIPVADRCPTCHREPLFTDRLMADVESGAPTDSGRSFDAPHLLGIAASGPYLHDGRALSLEEIWTRFNPNDTHGVTNDLDKVQLNDLILYLRSL